MMSSVGEATCSYGVVHGFVQHLHCTEDCIKVPEYTPTLLDVTAVHFI